MAFRVLVIGGYGNFGSLICNHLVMMPHIDLVISGRDPRKLAEKVAALQTLGGQVLRELVRGHHAGRRGH